jgi:beta-glucosidase-like glycosyl hydrolase
MRREPPLQAHAELGRRRRTQSSSGASPLVVAGIVLLAASLVVVGAVVVLSSLGSGGSQTPAPTPTATRSTPGVFTVGRQDQTPDSGAAPTIAPTQAASTGDPSSGSGSQTLATPATGGGQPIFSPSAPLAGPGGAASPGSATAPPGDGSTQTSPAAVDLATPTTSSQVIQPIPTAAEGPSPAASGSPATAASPLDQAVSDAMARLTTDEDRIGQLLLLGWIGDTAEKARPELEELRAGGIVFVQNATASADARTINQGLKQIASDANLTPPLIAIDHEGGIVQRIKDVPNLNNNWDFALTNPTDAQACQRGLAHAQTLKDMGFSMNLAPVLDVNNNPANPVIGKRSYSADPEVVARLGAAYIRGLQGGGIVAVGKHFPGHGNTSTDSHLGLPLQPQSVEDLDKIELVPFKRAIQTGIAGIMSAHIVFPAVDPSGVPATLSQPVMTGLLRNQLGFGGLSLSDDMGAMKAITDNYAPGDAAVRAVNAGVDMMILSAEIGRQRQARDGLLAAVESGAISQARLDEAVRHVLTAKARFGLLPGTQAEAGSGCS